MPFIRNIVSAACDRRSLEHPSVDYESIREKYKNDLRCVGSAFSTQDDCLIIDEIEREIKQLEAHNASH